MKSDGIRKLYHSISEVAEMTDLKPHVLRYWETEFEQLQPKKNRAGNRIYTQRDIDLIKRIQYLLKEERYTLDGARQALLRDDQIADTPATDQLLQLRAFLEDVLRRLP